MKFKITTFGLFLLGTTTLFAQDVKETKELQTTKPAKEIELNEAKKTELAKQRNEVKKSQLKTKANVNEDAKKPVMKANVNQSGSLRKTEELKASEGTKLEPANRQKLEEVRVSNGTSKTIQASSIKSQEKAVQTK